mgnify:CR=1 FL=1
MIVKIKTIKAKKEETYPDWVIDILCKYFQESKNHVSEYLYLIAKSELKTILEMYGTDPKQIKKLKLENCQQQKEMKHPNHNPKILAIL